MTHWCGWFRFNSPHKGPVRRSIDDFSAVRLNKLWNKHHDMMWLLRKTTYRNTHTWPSQSSFRVFIVNISKQAHRVTTEARSIISEVITVCQYPNVASRQCCRVLYTWAFVWFADVYVVSTSYSNRLQILIDNRTPVCNKWPEYADVLLDVNWWGFYLLPAAELWMILNRYMVPYINRWMQNGDGININLGMGQHIDVYIGIGKNIFICMEGIGVAKNMDKDLDVVMTIHCALNAL